MKKIREFIILALIQLSLQVEHCYVEQKVCKKCAEGYFLVNEKCVTVDHCEYIDSNTNKCQSCQYGYRLNEDKTSCVEIGEDHCSTYTNLEDGTYLAGLKENGRNPKWELLEDVIVKDGIIISELKLKGHSYWATEKKVKEELLAGTEIWIKSETFVPYAGYNPAKKIT